MPTTSTSSPSGRWPRLRGAGHTRRQYPARQQRRRQRACLPALQRRVPGRRLHQQRRYVAISSGCRPPVDQPSRSTTALPGNPCRWATSSAAAPPVPAAARAGLPPPGHLTSRIDQRVLRWLKTTGGAKLRPRCDSPQVPSARKSIQRGPQAGGEVAHGSRPIRPGATRALPTMKPSVSGLTCRACSGPPIPKPRTSGLSVRPACGR